jgi:hypothetical protein
MLDGFGYPKDWRIFVWAMTLAANGHKEFSADDELGGRFMLIAEQIYEPLPTPIDDDDEKDSHNISLWESRLSERLRHFEPELARLRR